MSLTGRFSALVLATVGLVLVGFSTALYVSARVYLDRQVGDRLAAALAVLAAAAEIHPEGVEWEPQERVLTLGQDSGSDRLRWMVFDDRGRRLDQSRNLDGAGLTADWTPPPGTAELPDPLADRYGRLWRVSQRRIGAAGSFTPVSDSKATPAEGRPNDPARPDTLRPFLVLTVCAPLGPSEATLRALGGFLVATSAGICLLTGLACRRLSRRALSPLTRMVVSARGLDATDPGWSLDEAGTGDELDDLGRAINDLLARLHLAYERQRRFSGDASHQLRTPLTVLIGHIEVALRQERSAEEYRRVLHAALARAVQLGRIVEALLFLGRADADTSLPQGEPLELNEWVATHLAARSATGRASEVIFHAGGHDPLPIRAHPPLLGQLLDNLLDNACKYGQPGTPVLVEAIRDHGAAVLAVEDSGPGIPPNDLPRVFEPFYRSTQARRLGAPGVGLGLAVVHRIAVAFGGSVSVRSEPGRGCRFEVRIPTAAYEPEARPPAVRTQGPTVPDELPGPA